MRMITRPSERSTPEEPLFFCRVYQFGRCIAFGAGPTRQEAKRAALAELAENDKAKRRQVLERFWDEESEEQLWPL